MSQRGVDRALQMNAFSILVGLLTRECVRVHVQERLKGSYRVSQERGAWRRV